MVFFNVLIMPGFEVAHEERGVRGEERKGVRREGRGDR